MIRHSFFWLCLLLFALTACDGLEQRFGSQDKKKPYALSEAFRAVDRGDETAMAEMLAAGLSPDSLNQHGDSLLLWAAYQRRTGMVQNMVRHNGDPNLAGGMGRTALHWAARNGDAPTVEVLLQAGGDPDLLDKGGYSPLILAAKQGYPDTVEILLDGGADPTVSDDRGYTALMLALWHRQGEVIEPLIRHGSDLFQQTDNGTTALDIAIQRGSDRFLRSASVRKRYPRIEKELNLRTPTKFVNADLKPDWNWQRVSRLIHVRVNQAREEHGLSAIGYDEDLAEVATTHSRDMAQRDFFNHINPDGDGPTDRARAAGYPIEREMDGGIIRTGIAENIYQGYLMSGSVTTVTNGVREVEHHWLSEDDLARLAVDGWMNSPGHRENILTPDHRVEGIGIAVRDDHAIFITQNFF